MSAAPQRPGTAVRSDLAWPEMWRAEPRQCAEPAGVKARNHGSKTLNGWQHGMVAYGRSEDAALLTSSAR